MKPIETLFYSAKPYVTALCVCVACVETTVIYCIVATDRSECMFMRLCAHVVYSISNALVIINSQSVFSVW